MTSLVTLDTLRTLTEEELIQRANSAGERCQQAGKKTVQEAIESGQALIVLKEKIPHGEWLKWLGANWDYNRQTAAAYMKLAANVQRCTFESADSIRGAMRLIAAESASEDAPAETPRSERKPATVTVSKPGQTDAQPEADQDDDPTPAPPTNRKTSPGSRKVSEADKPKTREVQAVQAEILPPEEDPEQSPEMRIKFAVRELSQVLSQIDVSERKKTAKQLRNLADELDPPTKFVRPDLEEVAAYFAELKAADPDSFFDFYESKGWLVGKVSMKDWRASARKWVRENQANPFSGGKGNGNSNSNRNRALTAEDVFSPESLGGGR